MTRHDVKFDRQNLFIQLIDVTFSVHNLKPPIAFHFPLENILWCSVIKPTVLRSQCYFSMWNRMPKSGIFYSIKQPNCIVVENSEDDLLFLEWESYQELKVMFCLILLHDKIPPGDIYVMKHPASELSMFISLYDNKNVFLYMVILFTVMIIFQVKVWSFSNWTTKIIYQILV